MLNLLRSKENIFPDLKLGKSKTKPKRFVTLENLLGTFLQIRKDPTLTSLLFLVIICRYGEVFNLATIDYCSYLLDWVLSAFFSLSFVKKVQGKNSRQSRKKKENGVTHMQANREDRGLATTDFQGNGWREICAPTLQEITSVKQKALSQLGLFFSRRHSTSDKSSWKNKRMNHFSEMNRKCHMLPSPDDYMRNILLWQKDQIAIWLHWAVNA